MNFCEMTVHIISFVHAQIPYLGKFWFCVIKQNALSQLDFEILKSGESQKKIDDSAWFLALRI